MSPGFAVPAAKGGDRLVREDGPGDALVREVLDCVVFEYSLVARPAYADTTVDARSYTATVVDRGSECGCSHRGRGPGSRCTAIRRPSD